MRLMAARRTSCPRWAAKGRDRDQKLGSRRTPPRLKQPELCNPPEDRPFKPNQHGDDAALDVCAGRPCRIARLRGPVKAIRMLLLFDGPGDTVGRPVAPIFPADAPA